MYIYYYLSEVQIFLPAAGHGVLYLCDSPNNDHRFIEKYME
jgi:hypothetical protein